MRDTVQEIAALVASIEAADDIEQEHISDVLSWTAGTGDVFRRVKPDLPPKHLVCYAAVVDPADMSVFLVEHRNAGRWLPPGGHMEPGELPHETAAREIQEELGIAADFTAAGDAPLFVTVTTTIGAGPHIDVSLWHAMAAAHDIPMTLDASEFHGGRWWTQPEIAAADPAQFDPHFGRFLHKLNAL